MSAPCPAELQWRINHLAGHPPAPPPPEPERLPPEVHAVFLAASWSVEEFAEGMRRIAAAFAPAAPGYYAASVEPAAASKWPIQAERGSEC